MNGTIFPQDEIIRIGQKAHELGIKLHLDGARIWDVAAKVPFLRLESFRVRRRPVIWG
jgi:threonine aldolase